MKRILFSILLISIFFVACGKTESTSDATSDATSDVAVSKEISSFGFTAADNDVLSLGVTASISGTDISFTVPFSTDVTSLIASFETTGSSVIIGDLEQVSGATANDFTSDLSYIVTASDDTKTTYTVTSTISESDAKALTAFTFQASINSALSADITGSISGTAITATVPLGTDVTALIANFTITGTSIAINATDQTSGTTANDFTSVVTYQVVAADGSTADYTITVTIEPPTKLYLFSPSTGIYTGDLGGRAGIDATLAADASKPSGTTTVHGFISVTTTDSIANMPTTFNFPSDIPIYAQDGTTLIANNWADLLDGSISVDFVTAGIQTSSSKTTQWYSGSDSSGALAADHCANWTNSSAGASGSTGDRGATDGTYISGVTYTCNNQLFIIGLAY